MEKRRRKNNNNIIVFLYIGKCSHDNKIMLKQKVTFSLYEIPHLRVTAVDLHKQWFSKQLLFIKPHIN